MTMVDTPPLLVCPKPWWKSRMIWFNALAITAGLGSIPITGKASGAITAVAGLANIILRVLTTQPINGVSPSLLTPPTCPPK